MNSLQRSSKWQIRTVRIPGGNGWGLKIAGKWSDWFVLLNLGRLSVYAGRFR